MSDNLVKISELTPEQIASICDHTFLSRPEVVREAGLDSDARYRDNLKKFILDMVNESYSPYAVCVRPEDVAHVKKMLKKTQKNQYCDCFCCRLS